MMIELLTTTISPLRMCLSGSNYALEAGAIVDILRIPRKPKMKAFLYKRWSGR
jgi:hypothetical protein